MAAMAEQQLKKLWEQLEKKDKLYEDLMKQKEKQQEKKDKLYEDLMKQKDEMTKLEIRNNNLKHELKKRNTEYLRITRSLHIRSVCEEFETSIAILADKDRPREQKWKKMLASEDSKCVEVRECVQKCNLDINQVPKIAKSLFDKINTDVHGDFRKSNQDLHIITSYFSPDELTLIKCIIECFGIEKVVYVHIINPEVNE